MIELNLEKAMAIVRGSEVNKDKILQVAILTLALEVEESNKQLAAINDGLTAIAGAIIQRNILETI